MNENILLSKFKDFVKKQRLVGEDDKVLLTVSGGIDSVVMADLFFKAGYKFGISHCNFNLRGEDSKKDEDFVKKLAVKYKADFYSKVFNTKQYARDNCISIQMAARELRYDWFRKILNQYDYTLIATAHHEDDSIETLFINLIRGTGIAGLHGIVAKKENIIRPILFARKKEIIEYASLNSIKYHEDCSNIKDDYVRNKIRNNIIPMLRDINPKFDEAFRGTIERVKIVEELYYDNIGLAKEKLIKIIDEKHSIDISKLKSFNHYKTILYELLKAYSFNADVIDDIVISLDNSSGKIFMSPTHKLIKDRKELIINEISSLSKPTATIAHEDEIISLEKLHLKLKVVDNSSDFKVIKLPNVAQLDFDKIKFPLVIRKWKSGDWFVPFGMKCRKKLSDYFIDNKLTLFDKENVWLLCMEEHILWVIGHRIDNRYKITEHTKKVLVVEI